MGSFKMRLFMIPIIGKRIKSHIIKAEGGSQESVTLRKWVEQKYGVSVGMFSYGGCFSPTFNLGGKVCIGRYCSFATDIHYFGGNHPMEYASMSPYFYNKSFGFDVKDIPRETLYIGHDVWCGYGVIITNKCHNIGNGAVIAAGSIVTKDVPPYAIVSGSPAKVMRYRFDQQTIDILEKSRWYDLKPEQIIEYYDLINKPNEFANKIIELERHN